MWNGELGSDENFYRKNLKEINPRLKSLSSKKYEKHVKIFYKGAYDEPEIDEDVHAIMSGIVQSIGEKLKVGKLYELPEQSAIYEHEKIDENKEFNEEKNEYDIYYPGSGSSTPLWVTELTDYGFFEKKVNLAYSKFSEAGFVRYGRESNKKETIFFLIVALSLKYPEINPRILEGINKEDLNKAAKGIEHFFMKGGKSIQESFREETSDEDKYNILLSENSLSNFTASSIPGYSDNLADLKCPYCGKFFNEVAILMQDIFPAIWQLKGKALHKKLIESEGEAKRAGKKIRPYRWSILLNMFYSARSLENEICMNFFRENSELQKIWGIPRKTWSDKWNLLASLDENL